MFSYIDCSKIYKTKTLTQNTKYR